MRNPNTTAFVSVYWHDTLLSTASILPQRPLVVASRPAAGVDVVVEHEAFDTPVTIAQSRGDDVVVFPHQRPEVRLASDQSTSWMVGALRFVAHVTGAEAPVHRSLRPDWILARIFAISTLAHGFFIAAAWVTPMPKSLSALALLKRTPRMSSVILKQADPPQPKPAALAGVRDAGRHREPEGKFGPKDRPEKVAAPSRAGAPRVDSRRREEDRAIAERAGLLGMLRGAAGESAINNVLGPGGLGTGINDALGGLRGPNHAAAGGLGGLGSRGTEAGGGGRSIGIGGIGFGPNRGRPGDANIDLGGDGHRTASVSPEPSRTVLVGGLDRNDVRRVIRRNIARFRHCYERQLNKNPNLAGKVSVSFTIAPTGRVAAATIREDSVGAEVGPCVQRVMTSLVFPKPRGGGMVIVTYPFLFEST